MMRCYDHHNAAAQSYAKSSTKLSKSATYADKLEKKIVYSHMMAACRGSSMWCCRYVRESEVGSNLAAKARASCAKTSALLPSTLVLKLIITCDTYQHQDLPVLLRCETACGIGGGIFTVPPLFLSDQICLPTFTS